MRKTFNINDFKTKINSALKNSTCSADVRRGMIFALETVLFEEGYLGYTHLTQHQVNDDQLPGMRVGPDGKSYINTDDTRRYYYLDIRF